MPPEENNTSEDLFSSASWGVGNIEQEASPTFSYDPSNPLFKCPCSPKTLNGSWLISIWSRYEPINSEIRGPMRIEVAEDIIRISGDVYVNEVGFDAARIPVKAKSPLPGSLVINKNWYPAFAQDEYRWYFRSEGVSYIASGNTGTLEFDFARHLWDPTTEEFAGTDNGWMQLECSSPVYSPSGTRQSMTGKARIGGEMYNVIATKTSPYYRGCLVEVDVMEGRRWPSFAANCSRTSGFSFQGVYQEAGLDFRVVVDDRNIPEDPQLTNAELHALLAARRDLVAPNDNWHCWLLVGSRMDGTLGVMFDTNNPPHREGAVGFHDPVLPNIAIIAPSARGQQLGDVPQGFLRTLIHEAGHAFNLFHPKHDVHAVPVSTTIMNQTGDVMSFATPANPYPCNSTMAFNEHNRMSLVHSPDPQVKPGWKRFGWGHGSAFSGVPTPSDAMGYSGPKKEVDNLRLDLSLPDEIHRGEYIQANVELTNVSDNTTQVSSAINLSEGDLRVFVVDPSDRNEELRDVAIVCGVRRMVDLSPNESIEGNIQLFYTNRGFKFDQPGRYVVYAEMDLGHGKVARSERKEVIVRSASKKNERDLESLTMNDEVGLSIALGDFGMSKDAQDKLNDVMDKFTDTETGAACAMIIANSCARDFRDLSSGEVIRKADSGAAQKALDVALSNLTATHATRIATSVVSPRDIEAPVLSQVQSMIESAAKSTYKKGDRDQAEKTLKDFLA